MYNFKDFTKKQKYHNKNYIQTLQSQQKDDKKNETYKKDIEIKEKK